MKDYLELGPIPCDEECAQVGDDDYETLAKAECKKFIELIKTKFGKEPDGARLIVKGFQHDFGTYYEVICYYDTTKLDSETYAYACEAYLPTTWNDKEPIDWKNIEVTGCIDDSSEDFYV